MSTPRESLQRLVRVDKWIAGAATERDNPHLADQAQARADEGVKKLAKNR